MGFDFGLVLRIMNVVMIFREGYPLGCKFKNCFDFVGEIL